MAWPFRLHLEDLGHHVADFWGPGSFCIKQATKMMALVINGRVQQNYVDACYQVSGTLEWVL